MEVPIGIIYVYMKRKFTEITSNITSNNCGGQVIELLKKKKKIVKTVVMPELRGHTSYRVISCDL